MSMLHYEYPPARWPHVLKNAMANECLQHTKHSDFTQELRWTAFNDDNETGHGGVSSLPVSRPCCQWGWSGLI